MKLVCPECKNDVDTSAFPTLSKNQTLECNHCGISLLTTAVEGDVALADVADEGK